MRKKSNPLVVVGIVISVILGFVIATAVKGHMPADVQRWSNVVFWLVFTAVTGLGTFMSGWFLNKRK
jgi:hypothetical protein